MFIKFLCAHEMLLAAVVDKANGREFPADFTENKTFSLAFPLCSTMKTHPGSVVHLSDNPLDSNKVNISVSLAQRMNVLDISFISFIPFIPSSFASHDDPVCVCCLCCCSN